MAFFLGIDGGGTGCRAVLGDANGRVIGQGVGGPANINTDTEGAAQNILAATSIALSESDAEPHQLIATLGLAGGAMRTAASRLEELLPFARVQIVNDAITAARGALGPDDGILVAIGTGSVFAIQRDGKIRQAGGRGFLMGDEGSGAVLGRSLLAEAMRAADGFAPQSPLLAQILDEFGGVEGIIAFGNRARPAEFAVLAPRIVTSDDPAALAIMQGAIHQIHYNINVLQHGRNLPVCFVGGLGPAYAAHLDGLWPIRPARGSALDGALLMARQMAEQVAP